MPDEFSRHQMLRKAALHQDDCILLIWSNGRLWAAVKQVNFLIRRLRKTGSIALRFTGGYRSQQAYT